MRETTATSLGASPCLHNGNRKAPKLLSWGLFVCLSAIAFAIDSIAQVPDEMQAMRSFLILFYKVNKINGLRIFQMVKYRYLILSFAALGAVFFYVIFAAAVEEDADAPSFSARVNRTRG